MKKLNERFLSIYRGSWRGFKNYGWGATLFRIAFTGSPTKNLPHNTEIVDAIVTSDDKVHNLHLILKPFTAPYKRNAGGYLKHNSAHRVFIMCDQCDHLIPAGRIHQHKC